MGDFVRVAYGVATSQIDSRTYNQIMALLRQLGADYPAVACASIEIMRARDWYDSAEDCRYLLWNYEEHLAQNMGPGTTIDATERSKIWKMRAQDSIEHVFPQSPEPNGPWSGKMRGLDRREQPIEKHVGRIGNLLLLPSTLNSQAQRSAFHLKKKLYEKHHLRMIDEVLREKDWTLVEIESREKQIADWAQTRWADV